MDDFTSGPNDFYVHFISTDESCIKQENTYSFLLRKPLEFPGEWEVGVAQIILKPPPYLVHNIINYISPDNPDDKTFAKTFSMKMDEIPKNPKELINKINASIPQSLKNEFSLAIDKENHAVMNIKNTQVKINSDYLTDVLGFDSNLSYPDVIATKTSRIRSNRKIKMVSLCPVFFLETDITVPETIGSFNRGTLCIDVFPESKQFGSYKYENISYHKLLRSYISFIQLSIKDIDNNYYKLPDPLIIKFHFRKSSIF